VISLAGISLSLLGIFGGVLGTGVLYFWQILQKRRPFFNSPIV